MSPSSRGRGLKFQGSEAKLYRARSPSSRGRGLKSRKYIGIRRGGSVALFTRAWIEIAALSGVSLVVLSPSSRGRGLKSNTMWKKAFLNASPSSRGRGLKSTRQVQKYIILRSPSSRGRGLKCKDETNHLYIMI